MGKFIRIKNTANHEILVNASQIRYIQDWITQSCIVLGNDGVKDICVNTKLTLAELEELLKE